MQRAQLADFVIAPVLAQLGMDSPAARRLMLCTAIAESGLMYLRQIGGPALGLWQMEPATHDDIWNTYLKFRLPLNARVRWWSGSTVIPGTSRPDPNEMIWNLGYACAMARVRYYRVDEPLPAVGDLWAIAAYWKRWYNTPGGAGSMQMFVEAANRAGIT